MSKVSALQKAGIVARVARGQVGRSRTFNAAIIGVKTTLRSFGRAMHQLWLEVIGTLFLAMALFGAIAFVREYLQYESKHTSTSRLAIAICFTLAFAWFGLSSFWRVRRRSQRP